MIFRTFASAMLALMASSAVHAVVIRHDVPDARYRVPPEAFPTLVDLPGEGHGVLIGPAWVVTAGHAIQWQLPLREVFIGCTSRKVAQVVFHPGYHPLTAALQKDGPAAVMAFIERTDDIALVRLAEPVRDIAPTPLYRATDEAGRIVQIAGKGATGNGLTGETRGTPRRGELRHAFNRITAAHDRWLIYRMDLDGDALPLEGALGHGDSGSPVFIQQGGTWMLAGIANHTLYEAGPTMGAAGKYGDMEYQIRVSYFAGWIDRVTGNEGGD